ncbi:glycosyltransferase [Anoxybacillus eryuanensis]|uniref:glycosyltransferase n=1 Tax=Anoxybacillus eryuanensis TaxID=651866 RepID=UPI003EF8A3FF
MNIFVNATAADVGGLHTIVNLFLQSIKRYDSKNKYYIFVSNNLFDHHETHNIKIIKVYKKRWIKRFFWDAYGVKQWSKRTGIIADKIISLQNTPIRYNEQTPQIIYLHTPLPFVRYNWNLLKSHERKLWFYKNIYPFFIKMFLNENCKIIVQGNWLKREITSRYKIAKEKIYVIPPNVNISNNISQKETILSSDHYITFFYPAKDYIYKNHLTLLKALKYIKLNREDIYRKIKLIFTLDQNSWVFQEAQKLLVSDSIDFVGNLKYEEVLSIYKECNNVLFPSYVETFGLPLIEAAYFRKRILCANEEYAREVIGKYKGAIFIESKNAVEWAKAILNSFNNTANISYNFSAFTNEDSWKKLFDILLMEERIDK